MLSESYNNIGDDEEVDGDDTEYTEDAIDNDFRIFRRLYKHESKIKCLFVFFYLHSGLFGTSSCFEFWWFELMVINVVFKFGPVELMVGL